MLDARQGLRGAGLLIGALLLSSSAVAQTITIGDTKIEVASDSGNGGLVLAQGPYSPTQNGSLQSLSFYVTVAAGQMYLGLYADNTGKPGALLASTAVFMPVVGWNTKPPLSSPPLSTTSKYWLGYAPSSNALTFRKQNSSGSCFYVQSSFQTLPAPWPTTGVASCTPTTWSFYATVAVVPPPLPPQQTVFTGPYSQQGGAGGTATCTQADMMHLNCVLSPPMQGANDLTVGPVQ